MPSRSYVLVVFLSTLFATVISITVVLFCLSNDKKASRTRSVASLENMTQVERQVDLLTRKVRELNVRIAQHRDSKYPCESASQEKELQPVITENDRRTETDAIRVYAKEIVVKRYEGENKDQSWSKAQEDEYRRFFNELNRGGHGCCEIDFVACKSTMCKLELSLRDGRRPSYLKSVFYKGPFRKTSFRVDWNQERTVATIYSMREGYLLPGVIGPKEADNNGTR